MLEKNRLKKCEKMFFNKHMNIVTKNGGKMRKKFFTRNKRISRAKKMEKIRLEKVRKHVFFNKQMNIVTKNGGKNASKKRWKKIVWKKRENTFFL